MPSYQACKKNHIGHSANHRVFGDHEVLISPGFWASDDHHGCLFFRMLLKGHRALESHLNFSLFLHPNFPPFHHPKKNIQQKTSRSPDVFGTGSQRGLFWSMDLSHVGASSIHCSHDSLLSSVLIRLKNRFPAHPIQPMHHMTICINHSIIYSINGSTQSRCFHKFGKQSANDGPILAAPISMGELKWSACSESTSLRRFQRPSEPLQVLAAGHGLIMLFPMQSLQPLQFPDVKLLCLIPSTRLLQKIG